MINDLELDGVDWASLDDDGERIPSLLRAMTSADPSARKEARTAFFHAVSHQGDLYDSTTAALPFLFALADDPATPDRAGIVALLLALGSSAVERDDGGLRFGSDGEVTTAYADCAAIMRAHADSFVAYASEPDPLVRRAALEGLGLFLDDAGRAVGVLGERLGAASDTAERLLVVETMATLALRLPATKDAVVARFDALADDPATDTAIRLGALVQRAHCDPGAIVADTVPTAIELLRRLTPAPEPGPTDTCHDSSGTCPCADAERAAQEQQEAVSQGAPPHIAAAFTDLARHGRTHAPTTALLTTFHEALGTRVPERTALLAAQLRSPDSGTRYDAIGMATRLINTVRGDHSALVLLVADCLDPQDAYTSAEAAKCLAALGTDAEPAREALASYVGARRDTHGPEVWAAPQALVRQAHQEAVLALAGLGDPRALPCVLVGLDSGVDSWRAVLVAGGIGAGAGELVPRLARDLTGVDFSQEWPVTNPHALASALGRLGDAGAVPALVHALTQSVRHEQWSTACSALEALTAIGPAAAPAPGEVRPLAEAEDLSVRMAATAALWALEGDAADVVPRLLALLDTYKAADAADVLGRIGPAAVLALPRLREITTKSSEWRRVHAAAALWDVGGEAEAAVVVDALLAAWEENDCTATFVVECLDRMGPAAAPALPRIRDELSRPQGSYFRSASADRELLHLCRSVLSRLG
ncbi:hypothetical protein GCM10010329_16450 [Streptomyces spiroverticillatus]|uniref:HEAT repeat domain-containing protein n=1 Tax=Streptomyces finlayi TaxID=67296 RepID=A0A918WTQ2_9ACTN|nr:HEAT repeat domain-containing protein [Streptomyces finlayi]GGZ95990.1 hypothetical protein GCM10010329_16450 [Streptomyces spiroverticillatus]GHC81557.1 hypothetical protein GCM10010334_08940 [Streptomyces finlayi]